MSDFSTTKGIATLEVPFITPLPNAPLRLHIEVQLSTTQAKAMRAVEEGMFFCPPKLIIGRRVRSSADVIRFLLEQIAISAGLYVPPAPEPEPEPAAEPADRLPPLRPWTDDPEPSESEPDPVEPEPAQPDPMLCKDCQARPIEIKYTQQCRQCHADALDRDIAAEKSKPEPAGPAQGPKRRRKAK